MKLRLRGLDGLRGLAALSVVISHAGFSVDKIWAFPPLVFLARTLAVGPNSVPIFFVLSGFLIASLYSKVNCPWDYLKKRYARIFPVLAVASIVLGLNFLMITDKWPWHKDLAFMLALAAVVAAFWKLSQLIDRWGIFSKVLFYGFLALQLAMVTINLFIVPKLTVMHQLMLPLSLKNWLLMLSNITLTTPFARDLTRFASIYWSLAPEIVFYLLYPFYLIPILNFCRKNGFLVSALVFLLILKVLFDLDDVLRGFLGFFTFNISRANGFLVGATIGSIYQSRGVLWQKIEPYFAKPILNLAILIGFFLVQAGDWAVRHGQSIWFMNCYYLLSSLVIGLLVLTLLIPNTLNERIFRSKWLVFLGMISYSLYLIHSRTISWAHEISKVFAPYIRHEALYILLDFAFVLILSIGVSFALYFLVERLYFDSKKTEPGALLPQNHSLPKPWLSILKFALAIDLVVWLYTGSAPPTLFLSHHSVPRKNLLQLTVNLKDQKVSIPIKAQYNNLGVITLGFWYYQNAELTTRLVKHPAQFYFRLFEEGKKQPLFVDHRSAYDIEGEPNFPIGFPAIANSEGKTYRLELELKNGKPKDTLLLNTRPGRVMASYLNEKSDIIRAPGRLIWNRLNYTFTHPNTLFTIMVIAIIFFLSKNIISKF